MISFFPLNICRNCVATANICKADCSKNDSSVVYCSGIDMFLAGLGIRSLVFQANHSLVFWANRSFFVSIIAFRFFPNIESLFPSLLKSNGSKLFMVAIENKKRKSIEKLSKKHGENYKQFLENCSFFESKRAYHERITHGTLS